MPRLAEVIAALDGWFDPRWAESWDAVGLACGDDGEPVEKILLAVDAVPETVAETLAFGAQLLITHHPLLLTGVHGVPAADPKGGLIHRLIRGGAGLFVAHTNADVADPGVSDALGSLFGLANMTPLEPQHDTDFAKLVVFVPVDDRDRLIDALAGAGAGSLGNYDRCAWSSEGIGTFRPRAEAAPALGRVDEIATVAEARVEMLVPRDRHEAVITALRAVHPYEEPAFDLLAQLPLASRRGIGRVGDLASAISLREFTDLAAAVLPRTVWGVRAAGDPDRVIRRVAVCGGAGGSLAEAARAAGADVFLTSDLKHHSTLEAVTERGPDGMAVVDAAHWATESPWLDVLARRLGDRFGTTVESRVSRLVTDPWTLHAH